MELVSSDRPYDAREREVPVETASFDGFYAREVRGVYGHLLALTGDRWTAEELTQEAFTRAYRDWDRVSGFERPGAWVRTVALNLARSRWRRLAAESRSLLRLRGMRQRTEHEPDPPDEAFWAEVRRLPDRQCEAVLLHYVDELSIEEMAREMGCAEGTAKVHLHRARRTLAERLGLDVEGGQR